MQNNNSPFTGRGVVLAILTQRVAKNGFSGTEIVQRTADLTGDNARLSLVYVVLKKMREDGLLRAKKPMASPKGGKPMVRYVLTTKGKREAAQFKKTALALYGVRS